MLAPLLFALPYLLYVVLAQTLAAEGKFWTARKTNTRAACYLLTAVVAEFMFFVWISAGADKTPPINVYMYVYTVWKSVYVAQFFLSILYFPPRMTSAVPHDPAPAAYAWSGPRE